MTTNKPKQPARHSGKISLRVSEVQKEAIDLAAAIQGKSRTEFILDAAYTEATSFLLERLAVCDSNRKFFLVDDATFEAFEKQPEATPDPLQLTALKALLDRPAPWD